MKILDTKSGCGLEFSYKGEIAGFNDTISLLFSKSTDPVESREIKVSFSSLEENQTFYTDIISLAGTCVNFEGNLSDLKISHLHLPGIGKIEFTNESLGDLPDTMTFSENLGVISDTVIVIQVLDSNDRAISLELSNPIPLSSIITDDMFYGKRYFVVSSHENFIACVLEDEVPADNHSIGAGTRIFKIGSCNHSTFFVNEEGHVICTSGCRLKICEAL